MHPILLILLASCCTSGLAASTENDPKSITESEARWLDYYDYEYGHHKRKKKKKKNKQMESINSENSLDKNEEKKETKQTDLNNCKGSRDKKEKRKENKQTDSNKSKGSRDRNEKKKEEKQSGSDNSAESHPKLSCPKPPECKCRESDDDAGGGGGGGGGGGTGGSVSVITGGSGGGNVGNKDSCLELISLITKRHTRLERKMLALIRFYQNKQSNLVEERIPVLKAVLTKVVSNKSQSVDPIRVPPSPAPTPYRIYNPKFQFRKLQNLQAAIKRH